MTQRSMPRVMKLVAAAGVMAVALAGAAPAFAADKASFDAAYAQAEAARKAARKVGYEWRDTRKVLKKAAALAKKGDYEGAIKLANEARFEGERGQAQAREQEEQWRSFVVK